MSADDEDAVNVVGEDVENSEAFKVRAQDFFLCVFCVCAIFDTKIFDHPPPHPRAGGGLGRGGKRSPALLPHPHRVEAHPSV